ncbi:MAG TPA: amidohydrolase family protein [Candidatus Limnocylindrales bacterium]|nr:amidohydrolase family protein [Candidatus Limnocylindrales bacterium]
MKYIDADGHVEECLPTFSDKYLDPAFRPLRPTVIGRDGLAYWVIDEQMFPRRVGKGCNNLGTPASYDGKPTRHTALKPDSIESMELTDIGARLRSMDEEEIAIQVVYPSLFLAYPLTSNTALATALYSSYNRWLGDRLSDNERIKWAAIANLDDVGAAVQQVREAKSLGASAVMVLGTAGDLTFDHPTLLPFFESLAQTNLPLAVHVGWSCPALNNIYSHIYPSGVIAFLVPVMMGLVALISGGVLDRFPDLRVAFLEAGCQWVHFVLERMDHRFRRTRNQLSTFHSQTAPRHDLPPMEYVRKGNLFFSTEADDVLLPHVIDLVGADNMVFGSDMPHGDREPFVVRKVKERKDISDSAKLKILESNPARLYGLPL